jgi:hypothetical protein
MAFCFNRADFGKRIAAKRPESFHNMQTFRVEFSRNENSGA